ncbi:class I SAM-dependent methyltransferase [Streptomyces sp. CA-111067]|uniref:class I SAM-dependent methyltransferase n=1 Tax=Streptomyces sp. CA-111067 TaxID=3240046 RepID=UPI003D96E8C9
MRDVRARSGCGPRRGPSFPGGGRDRIRDGPYGFGTRTARGPGPDLRPALGRPLPSGGQNRARQPCARCRMRYRGLHPYEEGDLTDLVLDEPVDALAGRIVLLHLHDPAAVLSRLARWVRPGGVVVFQDISCSRVRAVPQVPAMEDWLRWMRTPSAHAGLDPDIGEHLGVIFSRAGLTGVDAVAVSVIGDGDSLVPHYLAETLMSVVRCPLAVASGAGTAEEMGGFPDSLLAQVRAGGAMPCAQELTCAWARVRADGAVI